MSMINDLIAEHCPNGVRFKTLGEVGEFIRGNGLQKSDLKENGFGAIHYGQVHTHYGTWATETKSFVSETHAAKLRKAHPGDLVIATTSEDDEAVAKAVAWIGNAEVAVSGDAYIYRHQLEPKYAAYFFQSEQFQGQKKRHVNGTKVRRVSGSALASIRIPVPPLEVQREIVKMLDTFANLEAEMKAELEAELEARHRQYKYYRNMLLSLDGREDVKWMQLGDIAIYRRGSFPQPYGDIRWYDGKGAMPFVQVVDVRTNMRLVDRTKNQISVLAQPKSVFVPKDTVIVTLQGSIGRVAITQYDCYVDRTLAIFSNFRTVINKKYFAYQLQKKFAEEKENARGSTIKTITKEEFTKFTIPVPPIEEQEHIVAILDKLDALVNDLSSGLPAEIAARRQQYEHYRDRLLTFKEAA